MVNCVSISFLPQAIPIFLKTTGTLPVVSDARELISPRLKISWLSWNGAWEMMPEEAKAKRIEVFRFEPASRSCHAGPPHLD